jgi:thermostable 8-oxoguanine DNA glycosylase
MEALLTLKGVAVPTASALLAVFKPRAFGVIDIRAWQFLHAAGVVRKNKAGKGLSVRNWLEYLPVLRSVAADVGTSPRLVEIALYHAHKKLASGPLYGGKPLPMSRKQSCERQAPDQI